MRGHNTIPVKLSRKDLAKLGGGVNRSPATSPASKRGRPTSPVLKHYLVLFFDNRRTMHPDIDFMKPIENKDDLIHFIFYDDGENRSQKIIFIDDCISKLATLYFYTRNDAVLNQLTILLLNRIWFTK